jgi:MFS family permease
MRAPFFVYALTLTAASCVAYFGLPRHEKVAVEDELSVVDSADEPPITVPQALKMRPYWTALTVNLATGMAVWGLRSSLLPLFVTQVIHRDLKFASAGFLISSITQAALLLRVGKLIDEKGRKLPLIIGTGTLCASMVMLIIDTSAAGFFLVMFLLGIAAAFLGPTPAAVVGDVVGARGSGRVVALFQMTSDFGMIVGPLLAGYFKDVTGGFTWSFGMGLGIAIIAAVMSLTTTETRTVALVHPEGLTSDELADNN